MILLSFLYVMIIIVNGQNINRLSERIFEIESCMLYDSDDYISDAYRVLYDSLRKHLNIIEKVRKCNRNDTVFILEHYGDGSNYCLTISAWNHCDTLTYAYDHFGKVISIEYIYDFYNENLCDLVSKWDGVELKKESDKFTLIPATRIFAARIIFNRKKYSIDYLVFDYFDYYDRDKRK